MGDYSISEVARFFGVRVSTLRYYDELGLLTPSGRRGNVRHYGHAELLRLALIQRLHHQGLVSLADTATLLTDSDDRPPDRDVLGSSLAAITRRIEDLTAARAALEHLLTCPKPDPVRNCAYLRAELDQAVADALR
jgi:MerR family transcriptional regulator, copper efflux regulator